MKVECAHGERNCYGCNALAERVRREALEEAAKVADSYDAIPGAEDPILQQKGRTARTVAKAIRALANEGGET